MMTSIRSFIKNLLGKKAFITIVSGLPRSGTSMMMSALEAGGMTILTDHIRKADKNNPRGYFEFEPVKRLAKEEFDWLKQARGKAVKIISSLLVYLPNTFHYRVIFMQRDLDEILASQQHMLERTGKDHSESVSVAEIKDLYQNHLQEIITWVEEKDWILSQFVNYNDVLLHPQRAMARVSAFLNHSVDPQAMAKVVDINLYRERSI
ncbi:MAG: sulfotransferase family protein [Anaerolineales bacterium]